MNKKLGPWQQLSCRQVYENPWLRLEHHEVKTPANTDGIYGKICFKSIAVGVVPIDDEGYTYLVRQYRYPLEEYSWEIPEGGCPLNTEPVDTARRELQEETGLLARHWFKLQDLHTSNSVTDERAVVFIAAGLSQGRQALEATEDIVVERVLLADAVAMALDGRISDGISVAALLKVHIMLSRFNGNLADYMASMPVIITP
ncbi:MAG: NUDIX hydrolase [Zhongshania sp.]|uniref:NUDIX domain-containing protein n=1 Tax=Zhongshania sp. TaxID=1971902 RepID=UPI002603F6CD|nr:NUDIX hydrolase [Zhongshania sp.]MDF1692049.1 NUDIX hydrolase [Zhongshania sp.]